MEKERIIICLLIILLGSLIFALFNIPIWVSGVYGFVIGWFSKPITKFIMKFFT